MLFPAVDVAGFADALLLPPNPKSHKSSKLPEAPAFETAGDVTLDVGDMVDRVDAGERGVELAKAGTMGLAAGGPNDMGAEEKEADGPPSMSNTFCDDFGGAAL